MNLIEGIMTRRSVRKFTGELISDKDLDTILRAGSQSPSAHNNRAWEFIVIRDQEKLKEIEGFHKYAQMASQAGTALVVCGNRKEALSEGFMIEDSSAVLMSMLLASHGLGLGGVWCGIYDSIQLMEPMSKLLELPNYIVPIGMIVVGHKAVSPREVDRYEPAKIHYNKWQGK